MEDASLNLLAKRHDASLMLMVKGRMHPRGASISKERAAFNSRSLVGEEEPLKDVTHAYRRCLWGDASMIFFQLDDYDN